VTEHWYDQLFLISHDVAFTEITDQMIHLGE
jgi:exonuclease SbcC